MESLPIPEAELIDTPEYKKRAQEALEELKKNPVYLELQKRLENLPDWVVYHKESHTRDAVITGLELAAYDGLDDGSMQRIGLALMAHDVGFAFDPDDKEYKPEPTLHELRGAKILRELMKQEKYSPEDIDLAGIMVESTMIAPDKKTGIIKQVPTRYEICSYVQDADMGNMGRKDFFQQSDKVFEELQRYKPGEKFDRGDFDRKALLLIENHEWRTRAGEALYGEGQRNNIIELKAKLEASSAA